MLARLSRAFFYRHPAQVLLALIGIAAGVAVVTGGGGMVRRAGLSGG